MYEGFSEVGPMTGYNESRCSELKFSYYNIESFLKNLQGKVLTVIDATHTDTEQRKATKDILREIFCQSINNVYEIAISKDEPAQGRN